MFLSAIVKCIDICAYYNDCISYDYVSPVFFFQLDIIIVYDRGFLKENCYTKCSYFTSV